MKYGVGGRVTFAALSVIIKFLWHYPGANENNIDTTNGEVNKPVEYYFLYRKQSTVHRVPY